MTSAHQAKTTHRRSVGFSNLELLVAVVLLAIALTVVVLIVLNRGNSSTPTPPPPSQEEIENELGLLQQAFQKAMQEDLGLTRVAAQARVFSEEYPDQQGGYVLLAQVRMGQQQWGDAYKAWGKALAFDDGAFELSKMAGLCAAKLGNMEQALTHYEQAVTATNGQADSEVYAALGRLQLSLENPDAAEQMFGKAAEARGPGEETNYKHEAYAGLADVAVVREDFDTALSWVDRAIRMAGIDSKADEAGYHIQKARIYMDAGRDEDAVTILSYTWSEYADAVTRIESARLRARLYERAGELNTAVDHIQSVTELQRLSETRNNETLANFTALLADWQIKAKRTSDARVSLHNLQTLMPDHPAISELKMRLP